MLHDPSSYSEPLDIKEINLKQEEKAAHIEFIMKDISTVKYKPQNLWRWAEIAMEAVRSNPVKK